MGIPVSPSPLRKWARWALWSFLTLFFVASLGVIAGAAIVIRESGISGSLFPLFQAAYILRSSYVSEISEEELREKILAGTLSQLDPHSGYLSPKNRASMMEQIDGVYGGIGMTARSQDGNIVIQEVQPDSPADLAGVLPGKTLVEINGAPVDREDLGATLDRIRGPIGTSVKISLLDKNGKKESVSVSRAPISVPSVQWSLLSASKNSKAVYIRVRTFGDQTAREARQALEAAAMKAGESDFAGVIVDLRGNPGGLLEAAVDLSGIFVQPETLIVSSRGRAPEETRDYSTLPEAFSDPTLIPFRSLPVSVLVDGASASASEIFAAALQELGRAVVVGSQTFGKGSVQGVYPLSNGGAIKVTTSLYYTPKGRSIQAHGVSPDIPVALPGSSPWMSEADLPGHLSSPSGSEGKASPLLDKSGKQGKASSRSVAPEEKDYSMFSVEIPLSSLDAAQKKALEALSDPKRFQKTAGSTS